MASQMSMPYQFRPINLIPPQAGGSSITSANYVNMENALKAWIVVTVNQGNAATVALTPLQATALAGTGSKAIGGADSSVPIWLADATASSDLLVVQTAALNFTTDATLANKIIIFEITPEAALDLVNGFNHIGIEIGGSNAANIVSAEIFMWQSYQGASAPSTLV
jgi:hypothetical protein